ncbi:nicotinate-nucleotide adenylyltransferase [Dokdonia sinensis]|uniref:Nicotinate-nucleotide adenylyltransferase n=1 Tax=Dokdonia sinensis TaxID=2479847 RepID=A0A3M0GPG8_9FLAO|nr:ATP-binding protein [Dokdonia sinensis]RMB59166.1 nicotinate-nucleotide adenylyltransferase [Dokdonia sinensis]
MEKALKQQPSTCIRICLFGPESSGKSTLSRKLSQHYTAPLVPEYAREYLQDLWEREQKICRPKDLLPIAAGQMKLENQAVQVAKKLIICDTDLLTTKVYSEAYYQGWCPPLLSKYALENRYDLYLLTYIDTPWTQDDLRDRPERREEMFSYFKAALDDNNRPYVLLKGGVEERMKMAIQSINNLNF